MALLGWPLTIPDEDVGPRRSGRACRHAFKELKVIKYLSERECQFTGPLALWRTESDFAFWAPPRSRKAPACQRDLDRAQAMPYTHVQT
jgi:hypothetical protein